MTVLCIYLYLYVCLFLPNPLALNPLTQNYVKSDHSMFQSFPDSFSRELLIFSSRLLKFLHIRWNYQYPAFSSLIALPYDFFSHHLCFWCGNHHCQQPQTPNNHYSVHPTLSLLSIQINSGNTFSPLILNASYILPWINSIIVYKIILYIQLVDLKY